MALQLLTGSMCCHYMLLYAHKCDPVTALEFMLRTPLAYKRSVRASVMSLLRFVVATLQRILFGFLLSGVYVVKTKH